ncbi:RNA 2',3'-cyclic phosphodiesterase [Maridesulfovibrio sp.]|uniref:RNA 2',3'-cyclic phosphodiesterase n=1 Tax=Maridesulfovibrio sp. TaxID=2795000 RepID=UPI002A18A2BD|nr:RNA 2',3'-cyclic phosphodiesterase [Maridesulfovibrio sp.]
MKKIRTFIAHPVPEHWKKIIGEAMDGFSEGLESRISWVRPENMHFTLRFIGNIPETDIPALHKTLSELKTAPFEISAGKAGFFPGMDNPHIIWIDLERGAKQFCANAELVDSSLVALGYERNRKTCHAHLTLGRIKKQAADDWAALAERIGRLELDPAQLDSFALYKSTLTPEGPIYSVLHRYGVMPGVQSGN